MRRRAGCYWIAAGVVLALIAGGLAFWAILNASLKAVPTTPRTPTVEVVVASRAMGTRELIQPGDVELRAAPIDIIPENAVRSVEEVVGWITLNPLSLGEMVLSSNVISPTIRGENFAFLMDKSKVAMAFPAEDLMTRNNLLQAGDHVDLLFSIDIKITDEEDEGTVTFSALQNQEIAAIIKPRNLETTTGQQVSSAAARPLAIVFALDPQDALVLKHLRDTGGTVDIVLRSPEATERFGTQAVNQEYLVDRFQLRIPVLP